MDEIGEMILYDCGKLLGLKCAAGVEDSECFKERRPEEDKREKKNAPLSPLVQALFQKTCKFAYNFYTQYTTTCQGEELALQRLIFPSFFLLLAGFLGDGRACALAVLVGSRGELLLIHFLLVWLIATHGFADEVVVVW